MKSTKNIGKACEECGSTNLKNSITSYPVKMKNKQIHVGRVSVKQCLDCSTIMPTKAGKEKIARCMMNVMSLFNIGNN